MSSDSLRAAMAALFLFVFMGGINLAPASPVAVLTFHNDNTRRGANTNETSLTLANVNVNHFGRLFSYKVDGYVYAQPLIMPNVAIPKKGVRNVVFVATEHNSVYAFDADSNADADGGLLWHRLLGISAPMSPEYGARYHKQGNTDLVPEAGITGTPVIDPATGTIFVDVFSRETSGGTTNFYHRIHALDIATGKDRPYSPVVVTASVPGTSMDSVNGVVTFNARQHLQRCALTLANGILYVAYGSHADTDPYHGWIIGYDANSLKLLTNYVFNTTPNATRAEFGPHAAEGALWMGGNGLVVDADDNLYFEVANGSFSAHRNGGDYGDSFMKLSTTGGLAVVDYFTPFNQAAMQSADADLGSGGPILLPDFVGSAAHPHLIVGAGKPGIIHLVDRDNMGKYNPANDDQIVQEVNGAIRGGGSFATPAYFNHRIYYTGKTDNVKAFAIADGIINPQPTSKSPTTLGPFTGSPSISAAGTNNGIVWAIDPGAYNSKGPAVLHAYNANNLAQELYNSSQKLMRDNPGGAVKMTTPTIANGKVYVGAEYQLSVYGVQVFLETPGISPNGGAFTNQVAVTLAGDNQGGQIFYTLDGSTPTTNSLLYTTPFVLKDNAQVQAIAIKPGAVSSSVAHATFSNTSARGNGAGLNGNYYASHAGEVPFTGTPVLTRTDAAIDFDWSTNPPDVTVGKNNFTARWVGSVQPQYSETYTFFTSVDSGVRLYVNGQLLIDNWNGSSAVVGKRGIALVAQQFYNIEVDYCRQASNASVQLAWSSPSTASAVIPQTQLYPFTNPPPTVGILSPADNSTYTASASVTISAKPSAPHNSIGRVDFYANQTLLGSISEPPYAITATGLEAGNYQLTAVATDGSGLISTSAPVKIMVASGNGRPYGLNVRAPARAFFNMPATFSGTLPLLLSETGIFSNTPGMMPASGLISYVPNTPLWSDGAVATCYFAVPNHGGTIRPDEQINFSPTGNWAFPAGSVFVKTLELNTDKTHPNIRRRLETQLLVRDANGQAYGVTYKWRPDNSDADLLMTGLSENITVANATSVSSQTWYYASPADCRMCHLPVAGYVLGVNARQLNGNHAYPATGVTDNQLRTLNHLGLLNPAMDEAAIAGYGKLSALTNLQASLEDRARSYLDANCAGCHRPSGFSIFDARSETPLAKQNLINVPAAFNLGFANARIIAPKDVNRSVIFDRMNSLSPSVKMPLLGRNLIDTNAVAVMAAWINSLPLAPEIVVPVKSAVKTNEFE